MEKFENIESYFRVVNQAKKENKPTCTNCYLNQDKIAKLIEQRRLYYEKLNGGILIYVDEKRYYEVYYYLNVDAEWHIESRDKKLVIKNIYAGDTKNKKMEKLEERIKASGFSLEDSLRQVEADKEVAEKKIERPYNLAKKIMLQKGFLLVSPDEELIPQIREFEEHIDKIPVHQFPYFEDEELVTLGKEGRCLCMVNNERELCGVLVCIEENSTYGYTAIKEEYQGMFGLAILFSHYLLKLSKEKNIKLLGWIENNNDKAINYNMSIGYRWAERYMDEWILDSK